MASLRPFSWMTVVLKRPDVGWVLRRSLTVLGIESSCDDTCCSIVDSDGKILSDSRSSQCKDHLSRGGVMPSVAIVLHSMRIESVVRKALLDANMSIADVDAIAVASRPGLIQSLRVGTDYAKELCLKYNKPLIPVHHMEAHATVATLTNATLRFPFLSLLISGGHGQYVFAKSLEDYFLLGKTLDVAPGEALDKVARRLKLRNLGWPFDEIPGGRAVELLAQNGDAFKYFNGPRMLTFQGCDINFGDVRCKVLRQVINLERQLDIPVDSPVPQVCDILASAQRLLAQMLCKGIGRAVRFIETTDLYESDADTFNSGCVDYTKDKEPFHINLVVSGGVACNQYIANFIRNSCQKLKTCYSDTRVDVIIPPPSLCTDNGVMIAWNGMLKLLNRKEWERRGSRKHILTSPDDIRSVDVNPNAATGTDVRDMVLRCGESLKFKSQLHTYS